MKVLVTGHLGYIGTVMVPMLMKAGHDVVGCDSDLYERCTFPAGGEIGHERGVLGARVHGESAGGGEGAADVGGGPVVVFRHFGAALIEGKLRVGHDAAHPEGREAWADGSDAVFGATGAGDRSGS